MADVAMLVVAAGLGEFEAGIGAHGWVLGGAQNSLPLLMTQRADESCRHQPPSAAGQEPWHVQGDRRGQQDGRS